MPTVAEFTEEELQWKKAKEELIEQTFTELFDTSLSLLQQSTLPGELSTFDKIAPLFNHDWARLRFCTCLNRNRATVPCPPTLYSLSSLLSY